MPCDNEPRPSLRADYAVRVQTIPVLVQPGTGYDLLLTGPCIADRSTERRIAAAADIRRRAEAIGDGSVARTIGRIGRDPFINLIGYAHAKTEQPTAAAVVAALRDGDAREVLLTMVGYFRRAYRLSTPPDVIRDAADGDRAAIREFERSSYPHVGHWQATLRYLLGRDPGEVRDELADVLATWLAEGFAELEPEIAAAQGADADRVRNLASTRDLDDVLAQLVPGITFARELGQSLAVLTPSTIIRPGWAMTDFGQTIVIAYPAEPSRLSPSEPPPRLVLIAKALGDELRVRALRELRAGPMSGSELARRLGVPRTSLQHHLGILVTAGLARLATDDARWGQLELRPEALEELAELAGEWILEGGAPPSGGTGDGGSI
jgi:DNA-binding transcriptional ArsR family regulator